MHEILFISQQLDMAAGRNWEFQKNETMKESVLQACLGCGLRFSQKLLI
jgi:hypothetical protein